VLAIDHITTWDGQKKALGYEAQATGPDTALRRWVEQPSEFSERQGS